VNRIQQERENYNVIYPDSLPQLRLEIVVIGGGVSPKVPAACAPEGCKGRGTEGALRHHRVAFQFGPFRDVPGQVARGDGYAHVVRGGLRRVVLPPQRAGLYRQVANALARLRVQHRHHHANDVTWRAELSGAPGRIQEAQHIFIQVALHILFLLRDLHLIDQIVNVFHSNITRELHFSQCVPLRQEIKFDAYQAYSPGLY
jgi:hypothetical protein